MTTEQVLIEKIHILPEEKKAKVLEFVEEIGKESEAINDNKTQAGDDAKERARLERLMGLKGIGRSGRSDISQQVDEILAQGINKREGWSLP